MHEQIDDMKADDSKERSYKDRIAQLELDLRVGWKVGNLLFGSTEAWLATGTIVSRIG
jgi:hypothetical protein